MRRLRRRSVYRLQRILAAESVDEGGCEGGPVGGKLDEAERARRPAGEAAERERGLDRLVALGRKQRRLEALERALRGACKAGARLQLLRLGELLEGLRQRVRDH